MEKKIENFDNYKISYLIKKGNNKRLILYIHGWSHSKNVWRNLIESINDNNVHIALDLPGFGESRVINKNFDYKIETYGDVLKIFIQRINNILNCNLYSIIAHSMGGLITLEYLKKSRNFKKIALCGSPFRGVPFLKPIFIFPNLIKFLMNLSNKSKSINKIFYLPTVALKNIKKLPKDFIEESKNVPLDILIKTLKHVTFYNLKISKEGILKNRDFLIIRGKKEIILTHSTANMYKNIFNATLIEIPKVSHTYMFEDFTQFRKIILDFINK